MRSIKEIFVIGHGPSSSHTMGPAFACEFVLKKYQDAKYIKVVLFDSLAKTGKGHFTDLIIDTKLKNVPHEIAFDEKTSVKHPNTMRFFITNARGKEIMEEVISIGGGTIITSDNKKETPKDVFPHKNLTEILDYCNQKGISLSQYVLSFDDEDVIEHMTKCYQAMMDAAHRGMDKVGELSGPLHVKRKAHDMYMQLLAKPFGFKDYDLTTATYAIAVAEENADGGEVVIAPTCGSAGVIPGVIAYLEAKGLSTRKIIESMLVAGLIGIVSKTNGSISGAEAGCQAEIGVACAMGAALIASAEGLPNDKIAQSAEIALEHSLGLTCDPVKGYVQVPCIERCALYALKARDAVSLARLIPSNTTLISFDDSLKTMLKTGRDLKSGYRETGKKGLGELFK